MDDANDDDMVVARPRKARRLICQPMAWLQKQYLPSPEQLTLGSLGSKLAEFLVGVTGTEEPKRQALATLIGKAGFDIGANELVSHAVKAASNCVTPLRLMKRAPFHSCPTNARAVNFDPNIRYCSKKDVTMAGEGGSSAASNHCCRARNAVLEAWKGIAQHWNTKLRLVMTSARQERELVWVHA
jgi:hypothetical protein